ncbi:MAG: c-type cytochrome domain-containing protein, partial [Verrucomicrobiota bacterium]
MNHPRKTIVRFSFAALLLAASSAEAKPTVDFHKEIQPILEFNCVKCHHEPKVKGGLRFDQAALFFEGGDGGPALIKGDPDNSLMIEMVELPHDDIDSMPPEGRKLYDHEIAKLRKWIEEGAHWPEETLLVARDEDDFKGAEPLADNGKKLVKIEAFPKDINLEKKRDTQSIVVMATYDDDTTLDVTKNASFDFADSSLVELKTRNHFKPAKNGKTNLTVSVGEHSVKLPVTVTEAAVDRPISFNLDVMPVFMREGCNTGACHGSARGQDGFMLSLFGYDPDGDHFRLTRELAGHRIN